MMKIAIVTFQRAVNHGAALQMYALCKTLEKLGNEVKIIDYVPDYPNYSGGVKQKIANFLNLKTDKIKLKKYSEFKSLLLSDNMTRPVHYGELSSLENDFDIFITGSDQVWSYHCAHNDKYYFLDFVSDKNKRSSYAVSFNLKHTPEHARDEYIRRLSGMKNISVRESEGVEAVKTLTGREAKRHIDPTLLLKKSEWEAILPKPEVDEKYIAIYTLGKPIKLVEKARELAKAKGLKLLYISDFYSNLDIKHLRGLGPLEFVGYIANAEYVFTNSFHGTAFSVILHKNFFSELTTQDRYNFRSEALLSSCGLESRTIEGCGEFISEAEREIDWSSVEAALQIERKRSADYFREILNGSENIG